MIISTNHRFCVYVLYYSASNLLNIQLKTLIKQLLIFVTAHLAP